MLGQKRVKLSRWVGRFGNNVIQLVNAANYSIENEHYFESPIHELIKSFTINEHIRYSKYVIGSFFDEFSCYSKIRHKYIQQYIAPNLIHIPIYESLDKNTLLIHIRSGDIFKSNPNSKYIQNPLSYFEKTIRSYSNSIVLCEDFENPIIQKLSNNPKVKIQSLSLQHTIATMLAAQNICFSGYGTFGPVCAMLSKHIKKIHITNIVNLNNEWHFNDNIEIVHDTICLEKYIPPNSWKNTQEQRKLMVDYCE